MDGRRIVELFAALSREAVRYKVVGGIALNLHGLVRATEDLDLFVDPDPTNVERLRTALKSVFADPEVDQISASDLGGDYPAIQYVPPDGAFSIDILARLGTAEADAFIADMERESAAGASGMPMCSKCQEMRLLGRLRGIKMSNGARYCAHITKRRRKCWAWPATPNCGKLTKSSNRLPKSAAWVTPSAQQTSVPISARRESPSPTRISMAKVLTVQGVFTAAAVWWDVVTTPRIHCRKIICTSQKRMGQR